MTREIKAAMVIGMDLLKTTRALTGALGEDIMKFPLYVGLSFSSYKTLGSITKEVKKDELIKWLRTVIPGASAVERRCPSKSY
jgi:hypothetical protein